MLIVLPSRSLMLKVSRKNSLNYCAGCNQAKAHTQQLTATL